MILTAIRLIEIARQNPMNIHLLNRLPSLGLSQCLLTAGCLFQAVWNAQAGQPPEWGVKDYDVFYFDDDLSWEAENEVITAAGQLFEDLGIRVDIKNQARVHLWYGERFGRAYPQLRSARDGVDRYLISGTCVAVDAATGEVYAPYGLSDIDQGLLRINPVNHQPDLFEQKARQYQSRWPWLSVVNVPASSLTSSR